MDYETERINKIPVEEPSIIDMTAKAIEILSTNPNGFFLMVEGKINGILMEKSKIF